MKVTTGKPIAMPPTTNNKTENTPTNFLDLMQDATFALPTENQLPPDTISSNESTTNLQEILLDETQFSESVRDVSDLIQEFLRHNVLQLAPKQSEAGPLLNQELSSTVQIDKRILPDNLTVNANPILNPLSSDTIDTNNLPTPIEDKIESRLPQAAIIAAPKQKVDQIKNEAAIITKTNLDIEKPDRPLTLDNDLLTKPIPKPSMDIAVSSFVQQPPKEAAPFSKPITIKRLVIAEPTDAVSTKSLPNENTILQNMQFSQETGAPRENKAQEPTKAPIKLTIDVSEVKAGNEHYAPINPHHIRISVNPVELGPVTAELRYENDRAELNIFAKNNDVSDMIKLHIPELKEQFNQMNIKLDNVNVNNMGENGNNDSYRSRQSQEPIQNDVATPVKAAPSSVNTHQNKQKTLVDTYI